MRAPVPTGVDIRKGEQSFNGCQERCRKEGTDLHLIQRVLTSSPQAATGKKPATKTKAKAAATAKAVVSYGYQPLRSAVVTAIANDIAQKCSLDKC